MSNERKSILAGVMSLAWQFVKRNGFTMSEALKCAWANMKLKAAMRTRIVKFYFIKVSGETREAYGTLADNITPAINGNESRRKSDTMQTYYDTEKQEWRCYKKANLVKMA